VLEGLFLALTPMNLMLAAAGALIGTLVGMLPGIGPINAIALLIPFTLAVDLPPASVLILLAAIYYGSQYGNSISTILLNIPGTASATVTAIDGYALTKKGEAESALATSALASFFGGTVSIAGLAFLSPVLSRAALGFGPAEYFALMVLAMVLLSTLSGGSTVRAIGSALIGLALATVGFDPNSAVPRYTFGQLRLLDGIDFVVLTIGLFAVSEVLLAMADPSRASEPPAVSRPVLPEWLSTLPTMIRGTVVGFFVGVLPGAGGTVASFAAYAVEKKLHPRLGSGDARGVAAPEAANNAAATGAMIPLLSLGVPGSGTTAVLLGALLAIGIEPGPLFFSAHPELFWALCASMVAGNAALLALNLPLVHLFVKILRVPPWCLQTLVVMLSTVAVYAVNRSTFDIVVMTVAGIAGYGLRRHGFPLAPVVLGFVLGGLMEKSLRRAMAISGGGWEIVYSSPLAIGIWVLAGAVLTAPLWLKPNDG